MIFQIKGIISFKLHQEQKVPLSLALLTESIQIFFCWWKWIQYLVVWILRVKSSRLSTFVHHAVFQLILIGYTFYECSRLVVCREFC